MAWQPIGAGSAVVCAGCKFYRPVNESAGECRRGPPIVVLGQAGWVTVGADEAGCGEFIGNQQRPDNDQNTPPLSGGN